MYYKITNTECDLYKKLHDLRTEEKEIDKRNEAKIKEAVGDDWDGCTGWFGQQNLRRCTRYSGFKFKHPENLPPKTWKAHKVYKGVFVPDRRTKAGREISELLSNGIEHSSIITVFKIFGCEMDGEFVYPFIEICKNGNIVVFMSDKYDLEKKFSDIIEITHREFEDLLKGGEE